MHFPLTFGHHVHPQPDRGEVPGPDLSPELVQTHPSPERHLLHHSLTVAQLVAGSIEHRGAQGVSRYSSTRSVQVLFLFQLRGVLREVVVLT